eukprot:Blabericola_migrator_1__9884@NODE_5447_length_765_cov_2_809456_g3513_i0_p1_GENE_NODE_5447_length_765_cov_2_809456_g3513_i0NODE_5447_length_765_cov_2_809456_g3513_i0_p1_ORF_typecomplete_len118_score10_41Pox_serthr_kin/PF05445_11/0_0047_NODE_5447_length_765_cov_2_809456_g3513_i0337690
MYRKESTMFIEACAGPSSPLLHQLPQFRWIGLIQQRVVNCHSIKIIFSTRALVLPEASSEFTLPHHLQRCGHATELKLIVALMSNTINSTASLLIILRFQRRWHGTPQMRAEFSLID